MNTFRNLKTAAREWLRYNWLKAALFLVLGFFAGAALAAPSVNLTITVGQGNVPTATWTSSEVTSCAASGAWSGTKATSGTQVLPSISGTSVYILTCTGPTGGVIVLSWIAPTQNTDGSALTDLAGYRIYRGNTAAATTASYPASPAQQIANAATTSYSVTGLAPGTYFFAISAYSSRNVESALSGVGSGTIAAPATASDTDTVTVPKAPVLTVTQTTAYDVQQKGFRFVLGREVGRVPLGTACSKDFDLKGGFYRVDRKAVEFSRKARSSVIVAKCA